MQCALGSIVPAFTLPTSPCQAWADAEDTAGRRARPWGPSWWVPNPHPTCSPQHSCRPRQLPRQGRCQAWNPGRGSPLRSSPPEGVPGPEVVLLLEAPLCPNPCREAGWSPASSLLAHSLSRRLSGPQGLPHLLQAVHSPKFWKPLLPLPAGRAQGWAPGTRVGLQGSDLLS